MPRRYTRKYVERRVHVGPKGSSHVELVYGKETEPEPLPVRRSGSQESPSWLPWALLAIVVLVVLLLLSGLLTGALLRLPSLSVVGSEMRTSEACSRNCTTNSSNATLSAGWLSSVTVDDVTSIALLAAAALGVVGSASYLTSRGDTSPRSELHRAGQVASNAPSPSRKSSRDKSDRRKRR